MQIPKKKRIRLTGQKKVDLQVAVLERDNYTCLQCECYTEAPPHHYPKISQGGEDVIDQMFSLCLNCHDKYPNWKGKV